MAVKIIQFNKVTGVTATPQAGGSLAPNTTYYIKVVAVESTNAYALCCVGAMGEVSDEISFTTTDTNKQALIEWNAVTGNDVANSQLLYLVFISDTSEVYYGKKSNKNYYSLSPDSTTNYTINDYDGLYTVGVGWRTVPFIRLELYPSETYPYSWENQLSKGFVRIFFTGVTTLQDIYDEAVTDGLTDWIKYDGLTFGVLGGWGWVNGDASAGTSLTAKQKTIILFGQSGILCFDPNVTLTFGEKTTYDGVDRYMNGCTIYQKALQYGCCYSFYYMANGNFNYYACYFYTQGLAAYKNCGTGTDFRNCLIEWVNGCYFTGANTYELIVNTSGNIQTYTPDHFDSIYNCSYIYFYSNRVGEYYRCTVNSAAVYDILIRNSDPSERFFMDMKFPRREDNIPILYWSGKNATISLLYTLKLKTDANATIKITDVNGNDAVLYAKNEDTTRGDTISNPVTADENGDAEFYVKSVMLTHGGGDAYDTVVSNLNALTLEISKEGYQTYQDPFTMLGGKEWEIALQEKLYTEQVIECEVEEQKIKCEVADQLIKCVVSQ